MGSNRRLVRPPDEPNLKTPSDYARTRAPIVPDSLQAGGLGPLTIMSQTEFGNVPTRLLEAPPPSFMGSFHRHPPAHL